MTFETFDRRDEETWPDQQKDIDKDYYKDMKNTMTKEGPLEETYDLSFNGIAIAMALVEL